MPFSLHKASLHPSATRSSKLDDNLPWVVGRSRTLMQRANVTCVAAAHYSSRSCGNQPWLQGATHSCQRLQRTALQSGSINKTESLVRLSYLEINVFLETNTFSAFKSFTWIEKGKRSSGSILSCLRATNYFWPKYLAQTYSTFLKIWHATFWNISFLLNKTSYSVILQKELGFRSHWINNVYPNLMLLH